eukprot:TRINITY_DN22604_c0_g1_i5.p1 TRINITY_DN22604_c0_g1~~TRINITY_DN22604_c0_g1_i5.p1  ORF type:complete len:412 (+),score=59.49 TRINITY_DN22604_c0_g1_i5:78-1313(+)
MAQRPDDSVADLHRHLLREHQPDVLRCQSDTTANAVPENELKAPGGFRRGFLNQQADADGRAPEQRPKAWKKPFMEKIKPLIKLGYYERLLNIGGLTEEGEEIAVPAGELGTGQTVALLVKSFFGSGITFTPAAFSHGGSIFSPSVTVALGIYNGICIWMLLDVARQVGQFDYGLAAEKVCGRVGKYLVQISLVLGQFGTNVAFMIFMCNIAKDLGAMAYTTETQLIAAMLTVLIPLSWVRQVEHLEIPILLAEIFIFVGLGIILWYGVDILMSTGPGPNIVPFNASKCGLFMGTIAFSFEGIPMMLPIRSSMREPEKFMSLFVPVLIFVVAFFVVFGMMGYLAYGDTVNDVVLLNLPNSDPVVVTIKLGYAAALVLSSPLVFLCLGLRVQRDAHCNGYENGPLLKSLRLG